MYGQTEATARLSWLPPELYEKKKGSIGKGIPGVELKVVNGKGEVMRKSLRFSTYYLLFSIHCFFARATALRVNATGQAFIPEAFVSDGFSCTTNAFDTRESLPQPQNSPGAGRCSLFEHSIYPLV